VLSRAQLVERAYGGEHFITERTVDSHIRRLRKKLSAAGSDPIETVYGVGYRLREQPA
jgi:DNA-binding response OmpR family regulator